jgi:hypothetical protein
MLTVELSPVRVDVLPADWRKVGQQFVKNRFSLPPPGLNRPIEDASSVQRVYKKGTRSVHNPPSDPFIWVGSNDDLPTCRS